MLLNRFNEIKSISYKKKLLWGKQRGVILITKTYLNKCRTKTLLLIRQSSLHELYVYLFIKPCPLNLIPSGNPSHLICIPSLIIDFLFNHTLLPYSISYVSAVLTKPNKFRLSESSIKTGSYFGVGYEFTVNYTRKLVTSCSCTYKVN